MEKILLAIFLVLVFLADSWGESVTEFRGKPLTEKQKQFLKDRTEALEEAERLREAELRIFQDAKFCMSLVEHATKAQETFDDCKQKLTNPILNFYEKWGKTERRGLLLNEYQNLKGERP